MTHYQIPREETSMNSTIIYLVNRSINCIRTTPHRTGIGPDVNRSLLHKTFTGEKLWVILTQVFFTYGKVNGNFMLTRVFKFYQSFFFFSGKSFMQ